MKRAGDSAPAGANRWIPQVAGRACLGEIDKLPKGRRFKPDGSDGVVVEIVKMLLSDDFVTRYHGRLRIESVRDDKDRPTVEALYLVPYLAALCAVDDVAEEHDILDRLVGLMGSARTRAALHIRIREAAQAADHWFEKVSQSGGAERRALVNALRRAAGDPGEDVWNEVDQAAANHRRSEPRFFHPYGFDKQSFMARSPVWIPTVAGWGAWHQHNLIGGPNYEEDQQRVHDHCKLLWGGQAARLARFNAYGDLQEGKLALPSRFAATLVPFLAAYAASPDIPERHMLVGMIGLTVMYGLNQRFGVENDTQQLQCVQLLEAARQSSRWLQLAAKQLDSPSDALLQTTIDATNSPSLETDAALREAHYVFVKKFGGP